MKESPLFSSTPYRTHEARQTGNHLLRGRHIAAFLSIFIVSFGLLIGRFICPPIAAHADEAPTCNQQVLPVQLSPLDLVSYHIVGWLCSQGPLDQNQLVQVVVHGGTYNHSYWDFPYQPASYSYLRAMTNAGYTVFTFDRLGAGLSDHPLPELVTIEADAYVLHQVVQDLRSGRIAGYAFSKVLLVGHSVGSAISVDEAATYADVDGVLLSGFLHFVDPTIVTLLATDVYSADLDPNFQSEGLPPGYLTTVPGTRGQIFYDLSNADPQVIATDEATKDTLTDSEFTSFFSISNSTISQLIQVPVLEAVGQYDNLFCLGAFSCVNSASVQNYEASYYAPQAHLQVIVIPDAGHDLNLQLNASTVWFPQAISWISATF